MHHGPPGGDLGTAIDGQVPCHANLRRQHDKIAKLGASGNASLSDHNAMSADFGIVADLY
ncbi:MAG: hypothetical protein AMXMBFR74_22590 [Parvibaculum sp.]